MACAVLFLPLYMIRLMNFAITRFWNFGSGSTSRRTTLARLGIYQTSCGTGRLGRSVLVSCGSLLLGLLIGLGAILGATALPVGDARRIERATDDVIAHAWEVADAPAADQ